MRDIPARVREAARRIGLANNIPADEVLARIAKSVQKRTFTASDFFCTTSDISLKRGDYK